MSLASVILSLGKVLEVGNLLLARVILGLGPAIQSLDLLLPGAVLAVQFAVKLGNVCDTVLVVLLLSLLQGLDLIFPKYLWSEYSLCPLHNSCVSIKSSPQVIFSLCGVDEGIVILLQGVVIAPQSVNL